MGTGRPFYGSRIIFGALMINIFTMALINKTTSFYMTPICEELGFSTGLFSISYSMAAVGAVIGAILAGALISKLPLRVMMTIGAVGTGLAFMGLRAASQLWHFYVLLLLTDLFMAMVANVPLTTMINNWYVDKRGMMTGLVFAGGGLGAIILSPLSEHLIKTIGWQATAIASGALILVTALPACLFLFRKTPAEVGQQPFTYPEGSPEALKAAKRAEAEASQARSVDASEGVPKKMATKSTAFRLLALGLICMGMVSSGVMVHIPNFLYTLEMDAGFVISVMSVGSLVGNYASGVVMDKLGVVKAIFMTTCLFVLGMVCLLFTSVETAFLAYVMALLVGFSVCIASVGPPMLTSTIFGMKDYSSLYGLNYAVFLIGCVLGPVICGLVYELSGYNVVWVLYSVIAVGMFVFPALGVKSGKALRAKLAQEETQA